MKTGTLVNRFVPSLTFLFLSTIFNGIAGQTLSLNDIPDQTIEQDQSFSTISLDDYINVPDNQHREIQWTATGANDLSVDIDRRRNARVIPLSESWTGSETITFKATDSELNTGSDAATFTINENMDDGPVVGDIPGQELAEGSSFEPVNLDDYVSDDDDSDDLTWSASGNSALSVNINRNTHTATIEAPDENWFGSERIVFKATTEDASSEDDAVFTLTPVNDPPVMSDIPAQTINSGESFNTIALDNYVTDVDNSDEDMVWSVTGNTDLSPSVNDSRIATISKPSNWSGSEELTFTVKDPADAGTSDAALFTAQSINAVPVVSDIPGQELAEGSPFQPVNLDDFVTDVDHPLDQLTWSASGNSALSVNINLNTHTATIEAPDENWFGSESIVFKVTDPEEASSEDEAVFTLTPVNDPPVIGNIPDQSIQSGESFNTIALDNYVTDVDNTDAEMVWSVTGNTDLSPSINDSRLATISQPSNWSGSEILTFTVKDPADAGASNAATFEAKAVNAIPVAVSDSYSTTQGATLNIAAPGVLSNDTDMDLDPLTAIKVTDPSHGTLTLNSNGSFSYVNDGTAFTTDAFTYKANDGTNESNEVTVTINITLVNVAPVLGGIEGSTLAYTEGDGAVDITGTITVADADNSNLASAVITISSNYQNGEDMLSFANTASITGSWNSSTGQLTLSGSTSLLNYRNALRVVRYTNSSATPSTLARTVTFRVNDGTDNSNTQSRNISVAGSNSAPVLAAIESTTLAYTEGDGPLNVTGTITVTDADNTNMASAVITISSNYQNGEDVLSFANTASITGSWNSSTGQLTLSGSTSLLNYRNALRAVRYTNSSATPSTLARTVTFRVNDGTDNSNTQSRNISVAGSNSAPVLAAIEGTTLAYTEGDGPVNVTGTITVTDADNTNMASAVITISGNYQNGEDVLSFTNTASITGSWNSSTGQLTLSGSSSLLNYRNALRAVTYINSSSTPSTLTRTVAFRVNDGTDNSNTQSRSISVNTFNSVPVLGSIETSALSYTEGAGPVNITATLTATDADDINLASATITVSGNYQNGEDFLSFINANGITSSWNAGSGQLTLSGSATVAVYQAALRSVKYANTSSNPNTATRNITFRVSDGTDLSNLQSRNITITAVNNPPVLGGIESADLNYTEGDGAVSVSGTITVTDADNLTLQSAVISISANYQNSQDVLSFTNANGISGSWNAATGQLTLTGNVSPAIYQSALRSVKYTNTSSNPNISDRTVTFQVSDGTQNSNVLSRNIKITRTGVFSSSIAGSASYCASAVMPIVLTVTDGTSPFTATLTRSGSILNKDTVITGIAASPYTINVKLTGSYVLKKLTDALNEEATVNATPVVLAAYPKPRGVLSGTSTVCNDGQPVQLSLNLTGTSPWNFTIRRGNAIYDTTITGATADPYLFSTRVTSSPMTVRLIAISDAHCTGDTIGSGTVRVTYLASPTAVISGQDTICQGGTGNLKVTITGTTGPWNITYLRDGANPTVISNITVSPHTFPVTGTGTFTLSKVQQIIGGGCTGRVSGTGKIIPHVVPTAAISGNVTFCQYTSTNLNVNLTGDSPWKFSYKLNSESPVEVLNVSSSPKTLSINKAGTYTLVEVFDKNCKGTISGTANVTMTPAPVVTLSGLDPAYNKDSSEILLTGTPSGGTFSGPGVIFYLDDWYFFPSFARAGTHDIVYSYRQTPTSCYGYDTAVVRVLEANATIDFPGERLKYCQNEEPFTVTGWNIANDIGSFTISGGTGLTDHGDNTATVNPALLSVRDYTITYTYFDGTTLNVKNIFELGRSPQADFRWESECFEPGQSIQFTDASAANFGNITAYNWKIYTSTGFETDSTKDISHIFPTAGNHNIELQVETSNGCSASVVKVFGLRPIITPKSDGFRTETFEESPLSWRSNNLATPTTNSWTLGTPDDPTGIHGAFSGINSWYTDLAESQYATEKSWVSSPCYNFTGMNRPMVKMNIWRDFNGRRDGAVLQATTDSAKSWFNIGQMGDGQNWFNEYTILGNPGEQQIGWSNIRDVNWIESRHALDMLKGKTRVQFRVAYGSDGTVQNTDGFAFDDFWIGERDRRVLIEHFTNTFDAASQDANDKLNAIVNEDSINTIDLQYHTSFPGNDPFNEQEPFAPSSRVLYYGISNVPYAILNGGYKPGYRFDYDSKDLDALSVRLESLNDALFTIDITESHFSNNNAIFQIQFGPKHDLSAHEYTLHAGIFERKVMGAGINGDTIYENVVRALLPDPAGITIFEEWNAIDGRTQDYSWSIPEGINPGELMAFAFIQDEQTSEIYQVNWVKIGFATEIPEVLPGTSRVKFIVFPNPARDQAFVRFDKPVKGDVRIEIFNNLGSLVYTENISQTDTDTEIMTESYPDGLYVIRITAGNEILGVTKLNITR